MSDYNININKHYGSENIRARILKALLDSGKELNNITPDDLASFDEFHTGGKESTRELAELAGLKPGMKVLDIGSGVGGPARTLCKEYNCYVVGIDLTKEFCLAAAKLNEMVGLSSGINFIYGNALLLPLMNESFDCIWSQNTIMNINKKSLLFNEINRVLVSGGIFAFETVLAGENPGMNYPSFWAHSAEINFLTPPEEIKKMLKECGFRELKWMDQTENISRRSKQRADNIRLNPEKPVGRSIIVARDVEKKIINSALNFERKHVVSVSAVYQKIK